ncbi:hypothetical protein FRB90_000368 [Tulasnella sp. 427]|nr:hypothetical protein FRB90_000368 [Tulasnella sp. 427]
MDRKELETYQVQLSQVELALVSDPDNAELTSLRSELKELISLTEQALAQVEAVASSSAAASSSKSKSTSAATTPAFAAGDECLAKYSGDGKWYPARITSIGGAEDRRVYSVVFKGYNSTELVNAGEVKALPPNYGANSTSSVAGTKRKALTKEEEEEAARKKKKNEKRVEVRAQKSAEQQQKQVAWQKFAKKGEKKGVVIAGMQGKSIFASPDNPYGRASIYYYFANTDENPCLIHLNGDKAGLAAIYIVLNWTNGPYPFFQPPFTNETYYPSNAFARANRALPSRYWLGGIANRPLEPCEAQRLKQPLVRPVSSWSRDGTSLSSDVFPNLQRSLVLGRWVMMATLSPHPGSQPSYSGIAKGGTSLNVPSPAPCPRTPDASVNPLPSSSKNGYLYPEPRNPSTRSASTSPSPHPGLPSLPRGTNFGANLSSNPREMDTNERHASFWRGARTQPSTPLLLTMNDSSISLPTDYEFRAGLVDDGVGGAIAKSRPSTSRSSSYGSKPPTPYPSSPLSCPEEQGNSFAFASQPMLRSTSLPTPLRPTYESFQAGLIAKERLAGSVALSGEAQPYKMSPASKSIVPLKGFNSCSGSPTFNEDQQTRSSALSRHQHQSSDPEVRGLKSGEPSFEVEDPSLSLSGTDDSLSCASPSFKLGSLGRIELLGGLFGVVLDESEGDSSIAFDHPPLQDPTQLDERMEPVAEEGTTPLRTRRHGTKTKMGQSTPQRPIPIVDDRSPFSDRTSSLLSSSMDLGTPRTVTGSTTFLVANPHTSAPRTGLLFSEHGSSVSFLQNNSEEILYVAPPHQPKFPSHASTWLPSRNSAMEDEVRLRRTGGSIGVIGEEVRNVLARSTSSTSSALRSSRSSLGDLTVKPQSPNDFGVTNSPGQNEPMLTDGTSEFAWSSAIVTASPLPLPRLPLEPRQSFENIKADFRSTPSEHLAVVNPLSTKDFDDKASLGSSPKKPASSTLVSRVPQVLLRRISLRRVSQEPAPSLPAIEEVSLTMSSPPISPSAGRPSRELRHIPSSNVWTLAKEEARTARNRCLQLGLLPPTPILFGSPGFGFGDANSYKLDDRLRHVASRWDEIPNWNVSKDWANSASGGALDLKWVYEMEDRNELEEILRFTYRAMSSEETGIKLPLTLQAAFVSGSDHAKSMNPGLNTTHNDRLNPVGQDSNSTHSFRFQPNTTPRQHRSSTWSDPSPTRSSSFDNAAPSFNANRFPGPHPPSQPHMTSLPSMHAHSTLFKDATNARQYPIPSSLYTTASSHLHPTQSSQSQLRSSASLPLPSLGEPSHSNTFSYSSYLYTTPHPDPALLQQAQQWDAPCGPRFLGLRSGTQRFP